jgi:glyoxylase-like metal-dependent hydrolase (beta-lactamase superfamily II)
MEITKVGKRGTLFTFYDLGIPTNIYVINAKQHVYIIDTYLGPDVMEPINKYIQTHFSDKPLIVVNSHSHWDHVWGNSLYSSNLIISHERCKQYMLARGQIELEKHQEYRKGEIVLTYPNLTFTDRLYFEEDQVLLYYTPGHTDDCISIIDWKDRVLFAGDNLERPIPYLESSDLKQYVKTLQDYLQLNVTTIIGGHTACEDKSILYQNLDYLSKVVKGNADEFMNGEYADYHKTNMEWLKKNT